MLLAFAGLFAGLVLIILAVRGTYTNVVGDGKRHAGGDIKGGG